MAYTQHGLGGGGTTVSVSPHSQARAALLETQRKQAQAAAAPPAAAHPPGLLGMSTRTMAIAGAGIAVVGIAAFMLLRKKRA